MANDNGSVADLTLTVLKDIRQDIREMRGDISEMRGDISEMRGDISEMRGDISEMRGDIRMLTARFDHFLEFGGRTHGELEARVVRLEDHVFRPPR